MVEVTGSTPSERIRAACRALKAAKLEPRCVRFLKAVQPSVMVEEDVEDVE
jgi:hypothetical protein